MALLPGDDGPYTFSSRVPSNAAGCALLDHLAATFIYHPREKWAELIAAGAVSLDGTVTLTPDAPLRSGMTISYCHGDYREPEVPTDWRIAIRGENWMAVEKPAGMPVHSTARIFRQTLIWQVRKLFGEEWSLCHRLDRDTSGLVLFARGHELLSRVQKAFANRRLHKEYRALLTGRLTEPITVNGAIGPDEGSEIRSRLAVRPGGKEAETEFIPLREVPEGTWCTVRPHQGRRHQIRVHAESIGHHIAGDPLYDGKGGLGYLARLHDCGPAEVARLAGAPRLWLHSCALIFLDPMPEDLPRELRLDSGSGGDIPV